MRSGSFYLPTAWLLFGVGVSGCLGYKVVQDGKPNPRALRDIQERTAQTRGLPFKKDVKAEVYSKKESAAFFAGEARVDGGPMGSLDGGVLDAEPDAGTPSVGDAGVDNRNPPTPSDLVAWRLGLISRQTRLSDLFRQAMSQNAAGVYVPPAPPRSAGDAGVPVRDESDVTTSDQIPEGRLFIVEDVLPQPVRALVDGFGYVTGTDWGNAMFLSHELTHALQDQHYDLNRVLPPGLYGENEDKALARKALVESEANLVAQAFVLGVDLESFVQRNALIGYLSLARELDVLTTSLLNPDLPEFYVRVFVEQYTQGLSFLQTVVNRHGWPGVHEAYRAGLPDSTEQLLAPEKFFGPEMDPPTSYPKLPEELDELPGFSRIESNVFGALLWRIFLESTLTASIASRAMTGWGGDRYDVYAQGEETVLFWRTHWDSDEDAREFFEAYQEVLRVKYPDLVVSPDTPEDVGDAVTREFILSPGDGTERAWLHKRDAEVFLVEGQLPASFAPAHLLRRAEHDREKVMVRAPAPQVIPESPPRPPRRQPHRLHMRVHAPHHLMAIGLGAGLLLDSSDPEALGLGFGLQPQFRWGFRQMLEFGPPFRLSLGLLPHEGPFQLVVSTGIAEVGLVRREGALGFTAVPEASVTAASFGGEFVAAVVQGRVGTVLSTLNDDVRVQTSLAAGVLVSPFDRLILHVGAMASQDVGASDIWRQQGQLGLPSLTLGSVLAPSGVTTPTLEVRLYDQLFLFETSQLVLATAWPFLARQRHVLGFQIYF